MADIAKIRKHMAVIAADGQRIGYVSRMIGADKIRLTSLNAGHGYDHLIPLAWVGEVDKYIHLNKASRYIGDHWENVAPSRRNPAKFDLAAAAEALAAERQPPKAA